MVSSSVGATSRTHSVRSRSVSVLAGFALIAGIVAAGSGVAQATVDTSATGASLASAIAADPSIVGAASLTKPPGGTPDAVSTTALTSFPTNGGSYGILTTGDANLADQPNTSASSGTIDGGTPPPPGGGTAPTNYDTSILRIDLNATPYNCLQFDFQFFSEEYPEFVGQQYNDAFIAELDNNTWGTNGSAITAPDNFAFDPTGNVVSINSTGVANMSAASATGTTYDGATNLLVAQTPIAPNQPHSLYLSIFDQGDAQYDSAVFLDNLRLGSTLGGQCQPGVKPDLGISLTASTSHTPTGITAASLGQIPVRAVPNQTEATASAPIGRSPIGRSPIGRSPIGRSPIGRSPIGRSPIGRSPIGRSPIGRSPIGRSPIGRSPLSTFPIGRSGGWPTVLAHTSTLQGATPQSVTLNQLLNDPYANDGNPGTLPELDPNNPDAITLDQLNLALSPAGNLSMLSFLLGDITWNDIANGAPGGWCGEFAQIGQPACSGPSDPRLSQAIVESEANGFPTWLTSLATKHVSDLNDPAKTKAFFWGMNILPLNVTGTFLGDFQVGALSNPGSVVDCGVVECSSGSTWTLAQAYNTPDANVGNTTAIRSTATFADLGPAIQGASLGDVVTPFLDPLSIDWENAPLQSIAFQKLRYEGSPTHFITYTMGFELPCAISNGVEARVLLPSTFKYAPGSTSATDGASIIHPDATTGANGASKWDISGFSCEGTSTHHVTLQFDAMPGFDLGTFTSDAFVKTASTESTLADAAPVQVEDGFAHVITGSESFVSNSFVNPAPAAINSMYVGHLQNPGDKQYFAFDVTPGDNVTVTLSHLPADYDLVLYAPDGSQAQQSLRSTAPLAIPFGKAPLADPSTNGATDLLPPEALQDVPFQPGADVAAVSNFRSRDPEQVSTAGISGSEGSHTYIAQVSGFNGASGPHPFVLTIRSTAPDALPACAQRSFPFPGQGTAASSIPTIPASANTLILVDQKRLGDTYGTTEASAIMTKLGTLAADSADGVNGVIVPVDASSSVNTAYAAADLNPCAADTNNNVVRAINDVVDNLQQTGGGSANLAQIRSILIVGDDYLLPHARLQDGTVDGNERDFSGDALFGSNSNEISGAAAGGYYMSDWPYGTLRPLSVAGQTVYLPQVAVGRLGGSASTIKNAVDQFISSHGLADPRTATTAPRPALETDYNFFRDGGAQVRDSLASQGMTVNRLTDTLSGGLVTSSWSRTQFANALFPSTAANTPHVIAPNAHYNQYQLLPGAASLTNSFGTGNLYTTQDLTAPGNASLALRLVFGIGCHFGLDIPDALAPGNPAAYEWEQAYFDKGAAVMVGNLGYGLGDTATVAFSERLMSNFASNFGSSPSLGQALVDAERQYFTSMGSFTPYDLKALQESIMWGIPMYRLPGMPTAASAASATSSLSPDPVSGLQSTSLSLNPSFNRVSIPDGRVYYSADGGLTQATHPYPIVPKVVRSLPSSSGLAAHGAIPLSLTYQSIPETNYAYANATIDSSSLEPAPPTDADYPATLQNIGTALNSDGSLSQTLVVLPGQFRSGSNPAHPENGIFRKFTNSTWLVTYGPVSGSDSTGPDITSADGTIGPSDTTFSVDANDPSGGVARVLVQVFLGDGSVQALDLTHTSGNTWQGSIASTNVREFWVFALDGNGFSSSSTNKARGYIATPLSAPSVDTQNSSGNHIDPGAGGWFAQGPVYVVISSKSGESFQVSVDGGAAQPAGDGVPVSGAGPHGVAYAGNLGSNGNVQVNIDTTNPSVSHNVGTPRFTSGGATYVAASTPITVNTSDTPSGIDHCTISITGTATAQNPCQGGSNDVNLPASDGPYAVTTQAFDKADNSATDSFMVTRDASGPAIGSCPNAATYLLNQSVSPVTIAAPDAGSGLNQAASTLTRTPDTSTVGSKTLVFTAVDNLGNTSSKTCQYAVTYKFSGFFAPVNNPTSSPPANSAKAGSTIPVKWRLTDANGVGISDPASFKSITSAPDHNVEGALDPIESYSGASGLQYLGNGNWQFNWQTPKSYAGSSRTMFLNLNDGVVPQPGDLRTAFFTFK